MRELAAASLKYYFKSIIQAPPALSSVAVDPVMSDHTSAGRVIGLIQQVVQYAGSLVRGQFHNNSCPANHMFELTNCLKRQLLLFKKVVT